MNMNGKMYKRLISLFLSFLLILNIGVVNSFAKRSALDYVLGELLVMLSSEENFRDLGAATKIPS